LCSFANRGFLARVPAEAFRARSRRTCSRPLKIRTASKAARGSAWRRGSSVRRLLMISPHFPPDSSAATHRVRLLAPHLPDCGWEPTVLTVDEQDYEGRLDQELAALIPQSLRVVRTRALSPRLTRAVGLGDLGLRALPGLRRAAWELIQRDRF